jgi:hypothetical protein
MLGIEDSRRGPWAEGEPARYDQGAPPQPPAVIAGSLSKNKSPVPATQDPSPVAASRDGLVCFLSF